MSLASLIKRLQDVMRKDPGVDGDVQRLNQFVWLIFLKVFDYKEEENELDDNYKPVIPEGYRWRDWANPLTEDGEKDVKNQLTGPELIDFVDNKLLKVLKGDAIDVDGKSTVVFDSTDERALLVKQVMADATNLMKNGYFLREVLNLFNEVDLAETSDSHQFSEMYEGLLDGLQAMGKYGEFHTVKAITRFGIDKVAPKLGERCMDNACGTGGFLKDILDTLESQIRLGHNEDREMWQNSVCGGEFKPLPYRLAITNLLLQGVDLPNIRYGDSLDVKNFSEYYGDDLMDVIAINPPYGGVASDSDKLAFPADMRSSETADLFIALAVKRLKKNGRAIVVCPDGFLQNTDNQAQINIRKYLLNNCNLHTVIRLPQSCFAPYTSIATNLLFFDKTGSTSETWFYRLDMPDGYKHFSKTKPMRREHFAPCDEWWNNRVEITDEKPHEDATQTYKARKVLREDLTDDASLDYCGYPVEEKLILSPEETIKEFICKRESLDAQMDAKLNKILDLLGVK
ncbi:MAG: class I SAM-dependent DNA methyltransferase [Lactobacillus johnsonii]|nr:class I SAM-dependent DNA methyltransferase [Lactobacillus johnsonii]